jgi:RNA polymerase sigma-70 factor (ECF subfamily)
MGPRISKSRSSHHESLFKFVITGPTQKRSNGRMGRNDHDTIRAVLSGDKDAYGALVVRHSQTLFRVAFRITGNEADAEDVVQEAFLSGYRKLESFQSKSSFGTWIYRIAVNCALDKVSGRKKHDEVRVAEHYDPGEEQIQIADGAAGPDRLVLSGEIGAMETLALRSLTATERTAFILRHMEGCTSAEIASVLGMDSNGAKQAVYRAVHKLRRRLAPLRVGA